MWKRSLAASIIGGAVLTAGLFAQGPELPPGPMQGTASVACLLCHDAGIIVQQKLTKATWGKVVDKMTGFGAPVLPDDRESLVNYLAGNFGPPVRKLAGKSRGEDETSDALSPACLICHDEGIIVQQQLSRAAWAKTVDKMTGLGAPVAPGDRDALIDYLSSRFPPLSDKD